MNYFSRFLRALCVALVSASAVPSQGAPVQWTLNDVTLQGLASNGDGRTYEAAGSFTFDAQNQSILDWNLVTTRDLDGSAFLFKPTFLGASAVHTPGFPEIFTFYNASGFFALATSGLGDAGGEQFLLGGHLFGTFDFADANITGGRLVGTVVTEPTEGVLIVLGAITLFGARRVRNMLASLRPASLMRHA